MKPSAGHLTHSKSSRNRSWILPGPIDTIHRPPSIVSYLPDKFTTELRLRKTFLKLPKLFSVVPEAWCERALTVRLGPRPQVCGTHRLHCSESDHLNGMLFSSFSARRIPSPISVSGHQDSSVSSASADCRAASPRLAASRPPGTAVLPESPRWPWQVSAFSQCRQEFFFPLLLMTFQNNN